MLMLLSTGLTGEELALVLLSAAVVVMQAKGLWGLFVLHNYQCSTPFSSFPVFSTVVRSPSPKVLRLWDIGRLAHYRRCRAKSKTQSLQVGALALGDFCANPPVEPNLDLETFGHWTARDPRHQTVARVTALGYRHPVPRCPSPLPHTPLGYWALSTKPVGIIGFLGRYFLA